LLKQDKLSLLEKRLEAIDQEETATLFLGKSRSDTNEARISLLSEIDRRLAEYGMQAWKSPVKNMPLKYTIRLVYGTDFSSAQL
jgi:hypothetical protein